MKRATRKKMQLAAYGLLSSTILSFFSGCAPAEAPKKELWIVTEQSTWDRMNGQLQAVEKAYEEANEGVDIRIDYLPSEGQEREVRLQQLRTDILQGGGPDCYLLPTANTLVLSEPTQYTYSRIEPLFQDVEIAMRNGLFCDITQFYDADDSLGKEELNAKVMDAGVVDGARYVLPLRYDIPVIYVDKLELEYVGLDDSILTEDFGTIMEAIYHSGDPVLAGGLLYESYSVFSNFIDYQSGNATLDSDTLCRYMEQYQKLRAMLGTNYWNYDRSCGGNLAQMSATMDPTMLTNMDVKSYIMCDYDDPDAKIITYPLWVGSLQDAFDYIPTSIDLEMDLSVAPLRTVDGGEVVATVSYYAAVGSGCRNPALAYDFLRQFLLEDSQWETNRPERSHTKPGKGAAANTSNDLQYPGLIESGWPVRDTVPFQKLWNIRRRQIYLRDFGGALNLHTTDEQERRNRRVGRMDFKEDYPFLENLQIGKVRFNTTMSDVFAETLTQLNDMENAPEQVNIEELAQQLIWELRWHVSEG